MSPEFIVGGPVRHSFTALGEICSTLHFAFSLRPVIRPYTHMTFSLSKFGLYVSIVHLHEQRANIAFGPVSEL